MPFERGNTKSKKAILLVHGLGDSPYSFSDLATTFAKQGFYVQVLLLPGHGSKPEDMHLTTYQDWQNIVDQVRLQPRFYQKVNQDFKAQEGNWRVRGIGNVHLRGATVPRGRAPTTSRFTTTVLREC